MLGYVHWSSVSSLVNKPFYSNQGVMGCIKDWSDILDMFILCCCVGKQMSRLNKSLDVKATSQSFKEHWRLQGPDMANAS